MKKLLALLVLALAWPAASQVTTTAMNQPAVAGSTITGTVSPVNGGTGVANTATKTITLGGPLVTSGAFTTTITSTGTTGVTLPTSGTLATVAATAIAPVYGTFTATLTCGTSGTITLSSNTLRYVKQDKLVTITGLLVVSAVSSPVGIVSLGTLPFANGASAPSRTGGGLFADGLAATATTATMWGISAGSSVASIHTRFAAGALASNAADITNTTYMYINMSYLTD